MQAFQRHRGLHDHGRCDEPTWLALVEASWRLGDRPLRLVAPFLRGDDVGTLQTLARPPRLRLRPGRRHLRPGDGRAPSRTSSATAVSTSTASAGRRPSGRWRSTAPAPAPARAWPRSASSSSSSTVGASLRQLRVVVGQFGGLGPLARHVAQGLRQHGAKVITVDELDPSLQAAAANRYAATVYVGFEPPTDERRHGRLLRHGRVRVGRRPGAGRAARRSAFDRARRASRRHGRAGMRLPVLRETRMTAVVCSLGPVQRVVDAAPTISDAVVDGARRRGSPPPVPLVTA